MHKLAASMVLLIGLSACAEAPKPAAPVVPTPVAAPAVSDAANRAQALANANGYRMSGDNDRAILVYDNLIKADPSNLDAREGKALALVAKGDYETPVAMFDEILKADPRRGQSLNAVGVLFTTRGLHKEAEQYFSEAAKNTPQAPILPLKNLALSQALQGKHTAAICTLKQTSDSTVMGSLDRKRTQMDLALVYAAGGQVQDALAIASSYYVGTTPNDNFKLYSKLAQDKKLANGYLSTSIVATNAYYYDGWKK